MNKKPTLAIVTDLHITESNGDMVRGLVKESLNKIKELGLSELYIAGDVFDARKAQPLNTLDSFDDILSDAEEMKIDVIAIPGNHDKVDYYSEKSYLKQYRHHPNLKIVQSNEYVYVNNICVHLIPYFHESIYNQYLDKQMKNFTIKEQNILITHIAINGVKNNDSTEVTSGCPANLFNKFDKVLVGHYHNKQEIGNILYIGSLYQSNFGEDDKKGITIVYDDLSIEQIPTSFKRYETIKYDIDTLTVSDLDKIAKDYSKVDQFTKVQFTGSKEKLATLDKSKFDKVGIKVECKQIDDQSITMTTSVKFDGFTKGSIPDEFIEFAEGKDFNTEIGLNYLTKILV